MMKCQRLMRWNLNRQIYINKLHLYVEFLISSLSHLLIKKFSHFLQSISFLFNLSIWSASTIEPVVYDRWSMDNQRLLLPDVDFLLTKLKEPNWHSYKEEAYTYIEAN